MLSFVDVRGFSPIAWAFFSGWKMEGAVKETSRQCLTVIAEGCSISDGNKDLVALFRAV